jgi:hypothetical protein
LVGEHFVLWRSVLRNSIIMMRLRLLSTIPSKLSKIFCTCNLNCFKWKEKSKKLSQFETILIIQLCWASGLEMRLWLWNTDFLLTDGKTQILRQNSACFYFLLMIFWSYFLCIGVYEVPGEATQGAQAGGEEVVLRAHRRVWSSLTFLRTRTLLQ